MLFPSAPGGVLPQGLLQNPLARRRNDSTIIVAATSPYTAHIHWQYVWCVLKMHPSASHWKAPSTAHTQQVGYVSDAPACQPPANFLASAAGAAHNTHQNGPPHAATMHPAIAPLGANLTPSHSICNHQPQQQTLQSRLTQLAQCTDNTTAEATQAPCAARHKQCQYSSRRYSAITSKCSSPA